MTVGGVRMFAVMRANVLHPKTRHVIGMSAEVSGERTEAIKLPPPSVLVIEQEAEGSVFLYRISRSRESAGDTWHQSIDDAKHQADYEYGEAVGEWNAIPEDTADARDFAVQAIQ